MAVLLVVSTLVAMAAAIPRPYMCHDNAIHHTTVGEIDYKLKGCTTYYGEKCIDGLPDNSCSPPFIPSKCHSVFWYTETFTWSTIICQKSSSSAHCYITGSIGNCREVTQLQQEDEPTAPTEGVEICMYKNGVKECRTLPGEQTEPPMSSIEQNNGNPVQLCENSVPEDIRKYCRDIIEGNLGLPL